MRKINSYFLARRNENLINLYSVLRQSHLRGSSVKIRRNRHYRNLKALPFIKSGYLPNTVVYVSLLDSEECNRLSDNRRRLVFFGLFVLQISLHIFTIICRNVHFLFRRLK